MEKEVELVHTMNRELGGISEKITSLVEKIEENHLVHIDNRRDLIQIKDEVKDLNIKVGIQNGRVTKSEVKIEEIAKLTAEMAVMVSRHSGELIRREKIEEQKNLFKKTLEEGVVSKIIYIIVGVAIFSILQLIFPNLELTNFI